MPNLQASQTNRAIIGVRMDTSKRTQEPVMSLENLAAGLAADFPWIDEPLIIALLSDYALEDVEQAIPVIREQLGLFEAALVPDVDDYTGTPPLSEVAPSSTDMNELNGGMGRVEVRDFGAQEEHGREMARVDSYDYGPPEERDVAESLTSSSLGVRSHTTASSSSITSEQHSTSSSPNGDEPTEEMDPREFLRLVFPHLPREIIDAALNSSPAAEEGDLNKAIEELLSDEAIRHCQATGQWADEQKTDDEDSLPSPLQALQAPKPTMPKLKKRAVKRTIPLVDTLKRTASPAPSRSHSRSSTTSSKGSSAHYKPSSNVWHTLHSLSEYMADILQPIKPGHFTSFLHSPKYRTPYAAVRASLAMAPDRETTLSQDEREQAQALLNEIYGFKDSHDARPEQLDLKICVTAAAHDVATTIDLMDLLAEVKNWDEEDGFTDEEVYSVSASATTSAPASPRPEYATPVTRAEAEPWPLFVELPPAEVRPQGPVGMYPTSNAINYPQILDNFDTPAQAQIDAAKASAKAARARGKTPKVRGVEHPQNWRTVSNVRRTGANGRPVHALADFIPAYGRGMLPNDATPGSLSAVTAVGAEMSVDECLRRAQAERGRRVEMARQAGKYYRHGSGGVAGVRGLKGGDVAGHYAREAREAEMRAREWELKAARGIVQRQVRGTGPMSVDLHYMTIAEAKTVALETAEVWYAAERAREPGRAPTATFNPSRPLTVVTGVGRHSAGGVGVLGPSVANALEASGWKIDRGSGERGYLVVRGRR